MGGSVDEPELDRLRSVLRVRLGKARRPQRPRRVDAEARTSKPSSPSSTDASLMGMLRILVSRTS